jgi:hypothetical protein
MKPFGELLIGELGEVGAGASVADMPNGDQNNQQRDTLSAALREDLISGIITCCENVVGELTTLEARLWHEFALQDTDLRGALPLCEEKLQQVLKCLPTSAKARADGVQSLMARSGDAAELDFADLLDWFARERISEDAKDSNVHSFFTQFFFSVGAGVSAPEIRPRLERELLSEFRRRCEQADAPTLRHAVAAYKRSMILTACWRCERRLRDILQEPLRCTDRASTRPERKLPALVGILQAIHGELTTAERALWEVLECQCQDFDGNLSMKHVISAFTEISAYSLGSTACGSQDFQELRRLREDCQRQSIEELFERTGAGGRRTVTIATVLRWWWDMSEDFRFAAGFMVPPVLLRQERGPEQMFRTPLRRVARSEAAVRTALAGHVRIFAELKALCVRRLAEGLHETMSHSRPTLTTVSEVASTKSGGRYSHRSYPWMSVASDRCSTISPRRDRGGRMGGPASDAVTSPRSAEGAVVPTSFHSCSNEASEKP